MCVTCAYRIRHSVLQLNLREYRMLLPFDAHNRRHSVDTAHFDLSHGTLAHSEFVPTIHQFIEYWWCLRRRRNIDNRTSSMTMTTFRVVVVVVVDIIVSRCRTAICARLRVWLYRTRLLVQHRQRVCITCFRCRIDRRIEPSAAAAAASSSSTDSLDSDTLNDVDGVDGGDGHVGDDDDGDSRSSRCVGAVLVGADDDVTCE